MSSSSTIIDQQFKIFPGFWVVCHSRTPVSESIAHSDSTTLNKLSLLTSLLILQVIPSLIGYIFIVPTFNCATWSLYPEHNFRRRAKLTSIFLNLSLHLEQQAWLRACDESVGLIAFHFILPFAWCRRYSMALTRSFSTKICRDHRQPSDFFRGVNWIHSEKYYPCSSITSLTFDQYKPACVWLFPTSRDTLVIVSWYLLRSSNPIFIWHHIIAATKHDCGIPNINRNIGNTLSNVSQSIIQHHCMDNIMIIPSPLYLNTFELVVPSCIPCSAIRSERYTTNPRV
jgi:hypothetical protein